MNTSKMRNRTVRATAWGCCALGLGLAVQAAAVPTKALVAQAVLERLYAQGATDTRPALAVTGADTVALARLSVARLGVREIVLAGGSMQALAMGPGMVLPRKPGPQAPVTVIAGHRDTHFRFVRALAVGDVIELETKVGAGARPYRVIGFETVRWDRFAVPSDPARPLLALATCYPFEGHGGGPLRRVVWAEAIP